MSCSVLIISLISFCLASASLSSFSAVSTTSRDVSVVILQGSYTTSIEEVEVSFAGDDTKLIDVERSSDSTLSSSTEK